MTLVKRPFQWWAKRAEAEHDGFGDMTVGKLPHPVPGTTEPTFWVENGHLFTRFSNGSVADTGLVVMGDGPPGCDLGPITSPNPKSYLVSLMRDLSPEDRLEVMGRFCCACGDEQRHDRRCQCWNDE